MLEQRDDPIYQGNITTRHYLKKTILRRLTLTTYSLHSLQGLLLLFLDECDEFINQNEEFYNPTINTASTIIMGYE